jgi:hypothetical protein
MNDVTLWIDPPSYHFESDRLFDVSHGSGAGDSILGPYVMLRSVLNEQGVDVHTADLLDVRAAARSRNLFVSTGSTRRFARIARRGDVTMSAFFVLECPAVAGQMFAKLPAASRVFRRMFAFNDGTALAPFLSEPLRFEPIRFPYPFEGVDDVAWSRRERSFLVMINANKSLPAGAEELYSERLRAIEFFGRTGELDLYGVGWDGPAYRVGRGTWIPGTLRRFGRQAEHWLSRLHPDPLLVAARRVWRGSASSKLDVLSRYRFSICIENQELEGWVTEKVLDCLRAGCVPVYRGAPDIETWIPRECFVDLRAFGGYDELREYLHSLSDRDVQAYREAGREFLGSERFRPFSPRSFVEVFARIVAEDAGVPMASASAA